MLKLFTLVALTAVSTTSIAAQAPDPATRGAAVEQTGKPTTAEGAGGQPQATTRQAAIEQEQAAKMKNLHPYAGNKAERIFRRELTRFWRAARFGGIPSSTARIAAEASRLAWATPAM